MFTLTFHDFDHTLPLIGQNDFVRTLRETKQDFAVVKTADKMQRGWLLVRGGFIQGFNNQGAFIGAVSVSKGFDHAAGFFFGSHQSRRRR